MIALTQLQMDVLNLVIDSHQQGAKPISNRKIANALGINRGTVVYCVGVLSECGLIDKKKLVYLHDHIVVFDRPGIKTIVNKKEKKPTTKQLINSIFR